jgi:hypothetical protein
MPNYIAYPNRKSVPSRLTRKNARNTTYIKNKKMTTKYLRRAERLLETSAGQNRGAR